MRNMGDRDLTPDDGDASKRADVEAVPPSNPSERSLMPGDLLSPSDHGGDFVTTNEQQDLARGLHQRHISLIALAGAIVGPFSRSVLKSY